MRNFNDAEKQKLIQIINQGSQVLGEVDDLKGGLRDTVKALAGSIILTFTSPYPIMEYVFPVYLLGSSTLAIACWRRRIIWTFVLASWFTIMNIIGNIKVFLL